MRDPNDPCLFCTPRGVTCRNELAYCARDSFPVSPGHSLIIPLRHCADFFELSPEEMAACMDLLVSVAPCPQYRRQSRPKGVVLTRETAR